MDVLAALEAVGGFLIKHMDIISLVIDAIENKGVDKEALTKAINEAATEASDAEMAREFPAG